MSFNSSLLFDALCDNFMAAFPGHPWYPEIKDGVVQKTFCNYFVNAVAQQLGYKKFWVPERKGPMTANEMVDLISTSPDWMEEANGGMGQHHANLGALVIAGQKADSHGHVAILRPGTMIPSGKWGKSVPRVANVGKDVFVDKGVNWGFEFEPRYWVLKSMLE